MNDARVFSYRRHELEPRFFGGRPMADRVLVLCSLRTSQGHREDRFRGQQPRCRGRAGQRPPAVPALRATDAATCTADAWIDCISRHVSRHTATSMVLIVGPSRYVPWRPSLSAKREMSDAYGSGVRTMNAPASSADVTTSIRTPGTPANCRRSRDMYADNALRARYGADPPTPGRSAGPP
jgi:hypothetical protein